MTCYRAAAPATGIRSKVATDSGAGYSIYMGLIRSILSLAFLGLFLLVGITVPVGERTLFGHVANIWESDEAQELVEGVKDSSGPLVDRVKRGVEAGLSDEATEPTTSPTAVPESPPDETVVPPLEGKDPIATAEPVAKDAVSR